MTSMIGARRASIRILSTVPVTMTSAWAAPATVESASPTAKLLNGIRIGKSGLRLDGLSSIHVTALSECGQPSFWSLRYLRFWSLRKRKSSGACPSCNAASRLFRLQAGPTPPAHSPALNSGQSMARSVRPNVRGADRLAALGPNRRGLAAPPMVILARKRALPSSQRPVGPLPEPPVGLPPEPPVGPPPEPPVGLPPEEGPDV